MDCNGMDLVYYFRLLKDKSIGQKLSLKDSVFLVSAMFLIDLGHLSLENQRLIVQLMSGTEYTAESLRVTTNRMYSDEVMFTPKKDRKEGFVSLTAKGFAEAVSRFRMMFAILGLDPNKYVDEDRLRMQMEKTRRSLSFSDHAQGIVTTAIYTALRMPISLGGAFTMRREFNVTKWNATTKWWSGDKPRFTKADLMVAQSCEIGSVPIMAIEVDRGTERVNGSLLEKVLDYISMHSQRRYSVGKFLPRENRADMHIVQFPQSGIMDKHEEKLENENQEKLRALLSGGNVLSALTTIDVLIGAFTMKNPRSKNATMEVFIHWIIECLSDQDEVEKLYRLNWYRILSFLAEFANENEEIVPDKVPAERSMKIWQISNFLASFRNGTGKEYAMINCIDDSVRKDMASGLYRAITLRTRQFEAYSYWHQDTFGGMMLTCRPLGFWGYMRFWYPGYFYRKNLSAILHNIGLAVAPQILSEPCVRVLVEHEGSPVLSVRNAFACRSFGQYNEPIDLRICIECISDDIGGLLRAQKYTQMMNGASPRTIMIALVDQNTYRLANGESLASMRFWMHQGKEGDDNWYWNQSGVDDVWPCVRGDMEKFWKDNNLRVNERYYPLQPSLRQEIIFLTYEEFDRAQKEKVSPWIFDSKGYAYPRKYVMSSDFYEGFVLHPGKIYDIVDWNSPGE